jgi:hypothetical protein
MTTHARLHLGTLLTIPAVAAGLILSSCTDPGEPVEQTEEEQSQAVAIFDGESLAGWSHVLVGDSAKMEDTWSVADGVLVCKGEPLGYLHTDGSYRDFKLEFEWRWEGTPGNSGVLLRIAGEPVEFMPKCVEAQLQHENAGDIWGFFGAAVTGDAERIREVKDHKDLGNFTGVGKIKGAEKPAGEWNHYEITVNGSDMELKVNGELVNQASGLDIVAGPIGLQSEGGKIHFRNVRVTTL